MTSEKRRNRIRKRRWQTAYAFPRVPRGVRAMPVKTQPRVRRGDGFCELTLGEMRFITWIFNTYTL